MVRPRVTRAVNPQRRLSAAQIRAGFGGKRRRNSLRASKPHKHRRRKAAASNPKKKRRRAKAKSKNPRTRVVYRTRTKTKVKRVYVRPKANPRKKNRRRAKAKRRNPGQYLLTMSPVGNPQRKRRRSRKNMAKTRRRARAKSNSGRKNPTRRRRVARRNTHHRHSNRSRNPFGQSSSQLLKKGAGVFVGFSIGKNIPPMLGTTANSSATMTLLTTAITAGIAAWAARKFAPGDFAEGVLWGGVGATINMAWNAWAPSFIPSGYVGVSGLRDFVPGGFPLPQVPVYRRVAAAPAATPAMPTGSGTQLGAWGRAF